MSDGIAVEAIERYEKCPRKFYYQDILLLRSRSEQAPYLRFVSVIRSMLKWMNGVPQVERDEALIATFDEAWAERGPAEHPHSAIYRDTARRMLDVASREMVGTVLGTERELIVSTRRVILQADNIREETHRIVVQRLKAGRLAKSGESVRTRDLLVHEAVSRGHSKPVVFEHVSLLTGERTPAIEKVDEQRSAAVAAVFDEIEAGRFAPKPNGRECPTCPYYFVCPSSGPALK